ncbi:MAG: hypothetical protein ACI865_001676 [Flavobacteriaceae bacterium]|jgi:hypothetical protein
MRGIISFIAFIGLMSSALAQDSVIVAVKVTDVRYEDPIQNVRVTITADTSTFIRTTSIRGILYFKTPSGIKVGIGLTHPRFNSESSFVRISKNNSPDTVVVVLTMDAVRMRSLDEVVIPAPGVPLTVFGSKRLHVEDFEILPDGRLILLTYPKRLKKGSELVLFDGNIINNFQVPGRAYDLVRDYRGNPHIVCEQNVYGIYVEGNNIEVANLEREYFTKYVAPIIDTNASKMYFSTFNADYPAFEYFAFDQLDSTYSQILGIKDDLMMELYRSEFKWVDVRTQLWAKNLEIQTGVDAEIYVGANYFTQSLYYKELYAPLFHRNDTLFVFDYYKDKLHSFDAAGNALDSVSIYHHYLPKHTGWKKQLIQDKRTGQIYAVFDRAGFTYIGWIDTKTGEISQQVRLKNRYVEKIAIDGNFVHYIYRPFESPQKKHLMKERLPYDFGKSFVPEGDDLVEKDN